VKISIITVCFNSEQTIRDTIESVLSQNHQDIEYIIIDGASTDSTVLIINEYKDRVATVVSQPDSGLYDAMNKGIKLATGDFVGILNSDDMFTNKSVIYDLAHFLKTNPNLDGAYGDLVYVRRDDVDYVTRTYSSEKYFDRYIRFGMMFPHPTFYIRRSLFDSLGFYKLEYRVASDFELMTRFIKSGVKLGRHPELMVKMRQGGLSTSGCVTRIRQNMEIVRACRENGIYTNLLMVALKIPFKLANYLVRQPGAAHSDRRNNQN